MNFIRMNAPFGQLLLTAEGDALTGLYFHIDRIGEGTEGETPILAMAKKQLEEYFAGKRREFDLKLAPKGTPFQLKVWKALRDIPYGGTCSYKDIAIAVDSPKGFRAVGMANNRNPISIIVPCHRVVGADGTLTGYGGGLEAKRFLLDLEQGNRTL